MDYHPACKDGFDRAKFDVEKGQVNLRAAVAQNLFHPLRHKHIAEALAAVPSAIGHPKPVDILLESIEAVIDGIRQSGVPITAKQVDGYIAFLKSTGYPREVYDKLGTHRKAVLLTIIRELSEGVIPKRFTLEGQISFVLQKNEELVMLSNDVEYYEQKVKREYSGESGGASIKVLPGWWVRVGDSKGTSTSTLITERIDSGTLLLTSKHLLFSSSKKSFKIRFDKIVSAELMADGIRITKDGANAKPQWFVTNDGWFYHKAILLLNQI